jgi:hypothetical protein
MKTAFLSALGAMGRRHLKGLVRAGFSVTAYDVDDGLEDTVTIGTIRRGTGNITPAIGPQAPATA